MTTQNESTIVALLHNSEAKISDICDEMHTMCIELSECDAENDQLFANWIDGDNVLNQIANRIAIVKSGFSTSDIAIEEIAAILKSVDK